MTRTHILRATTIVAFGCALSCMLVLTACTLIGASVKQRQGVARTVAPAPRQRIVQVDFGRAAHFAACTEPACPSVTRKTVALTEQKNSPTASALPTEPATHPPVVPTRWTEPEPTPPPASASQTNKIILNFATNGTALTPTHAALLHNAIKRLRTADRIVIVGRTDSTGSDKTNQEIALARALAIRDYLLSLAPDLPARITIDAKGRCCYAAPNETPNDRAQNRRVELVFTLLGEVRS